jgi:hypothetical protein
MNPDEDPGFYLLLTTRLDLPEQIEQLVFDIAAQIPRGRCGAIVLDTLSRSMGGRESKDEDMAAYIAAAGAHSPVQLYRHERVALAPFHDSTLAARCERARAAWLAEVEARLADHPAIAAVEARQDEVEHAARQLIDDLRAEIGPTAMSLSLPLAIERLEKATTPRGAG